MHMSGKSAEVLISTEHSWESIGMQWVALLHLSLCVFLFQLAYEAAVECEA